MEKSWRIKKSLNDLKLAKVENVDLTELRTESRRCSESEVGVSTATFGDTFFMYNGKRTIFKTYDGNLYDNIRDFRKNNEVICYLIGKQIGVECAKVNYATLGTHSGTISEYTVKNNEYIINAERMLKFISPIGNYASLEVFAKAFDTFNNTKIYKINKRQVLLGLYKLCVFDYLTLQCDRHFENIVFLKSIKEDGTYCIENYPVIDNEFAFASFVYGDMEPSCSFNLNIENILNLYKKSCWRLAITSNNANRYGLINDLNIDLLEIVKYAEKNKDARKFLLSALKNYNIREILDNLKNQGYNISSLDEKWYIELAEHQKYTLIKEIAKNTQTKKQTKLEKEIIKKM